MRESLRQQHKNYLLAKILKELLTPTNPTGPSARSTASSGKKKREMFENVLTSQELLDSLEKIENYGCHCIFGFDWKRGRSKPQNSVDYACKDLTNCYKCIKMDNTVDVNQVTNDIEKCDPASTEFIYPDLNKAENDGIYASCLEVNNGNICKTRLCACDTKFTINLIDQFFSGLELDMALKHTGPDSKFFKDHCPASNNLVIPQKECCGDYPMRFPYRADNGRACCSGKTFLTDVHFCCDGGLSLHQCN